MTDLRSMLPTSFGQKPKSTIHKQPPKKQQPKNDDDDGMFSGINLFVTSKKQRMKEQLEKSSAKQFSEQSTHESSQNQDNSKQENIQQTFKESNPISNEQPIQQTIKEPNSKSSKEIEDPNVINMDIDEPIPFKLSVPLCGHTRPISALALDTPGVRVLSGSYDSQLKCWDFPGMTKQLLPFRDFEPCGAYCINQISYSYDGTHYIVAPDSPRAKVFTRDGAEVVEFVRGDQYLNDLANTKGHTAPLSGAQWHPYEMETIMTSSMDSTVRIWNLEKAKRKQDYIIKAKTEKSLKVSITSSTYDWEGKYIAAACMDGSIQIWPSKGPFLRPQLIKRKAHEPDRITCINYASDGHQLITRGFDHTLKLWDVRKFTQAVKEWDNLPNAYAQTDCIFSPEEKYIITCTSEKTNTTKAGRKGGVLFIDRQTFQVVKYLEIPEGAIRVVWNPNINQIIVGGVDHKIHVFYDEEISVKGIMLSLKKEKKKRTYEEEQYRPYIMTPHALPLFKAEPSLKRQREKARTDPIKSKIPERPQIKKGTSSTTQALLESMGLQKYTHRDEDPREALLKYAEKAEKDPKFIAPAYKKTQPVPLFDTTPLEEDEEEEDTDRAEHRFSKKPKFE